MADAVRLCVQSLHPIHPGNYAGPIHCTAHEDGHACVTALYERVPDTTMTAEERHAAIVATTPQLLCSIERYGIRETNRHDYWCCARCGRRWKQNPGKPPPPCRGSDR